MDVQKFVYVDLRIFVVSYILDDRSKGHTGQGKNEKSKIFTKTAFVFVLFRKQTIYDLNIGSH